MKTGIIVIVAGLLLQAGTVQARKVCSWWETRCWTDPYTGEKVCNRVCLDWEDDEQ